MVTSPGHKLGQMIGNFIEEMFGKDLVSFSQRHGFYCDRKGPRPKVRGKKKKVTWIDNKGNPHDMDFVIEKDGSFERRGKPVAFIELAWRRYTKHSRNKAGEIEGALLPLRETYKDTCSFVGAILAGEFTDGGINQLVSNGIHVLHVPFSVIVECFKRKDIDLNYPEDAPDEVKEELIRRWESLSDKDLEDIEQCIKEKIKPEYDKFMNSLKQSLLRQVEKVIVIPLFGNEKIFHRVEDAIEFVKEYAEVNSEENEFKEYEVYVKFTDGDKVEGRFHSKDRVLQFLTNFIID